MPTTLTDRQTILDLITGLAFLGTGGGAGRIEDALEMLEPVLVDRVCRSAASRHRHANRPSSSRFA